MFKKNLEYFSLINLINIEINHKIAPIEVREKLLFDKNNLISLKNSIIQDDFLKTIINGIFILSTCNRTSLFLDLNVNQVYKENLEVFENMDKFSFNNFLFSLDIDNLLKKLNLDGLKNYLVIRRGLEAVENLLRISCGLESQIFGETDIIKQIKQYYSYCRELNLLSSFLKILINKILHYSKEFDINIRSKFNNLRNSFANFIVNFIKKRNYSKVNLLFIGLGSVSKQIIKLIVNDNFIFSRIQEIVIVSDYYENFRQSLKEYSIFTFYKKNEIKLVLQKMKNKIDFIIVNSKNFFLEYEYLKDITKDVIIFDLGIPRNVDSSISKLSNFKLFDLDKLKELDFTNDSLNVSNNLNKIIEFFIKERIKEFYNYIISRTLDKKLLIFYEQMKNIKQEILIENNNREISSIDLIDRYIKKLIYKISKVHKDYMLLTNNTGIFKRQIILGSRGSKLALIQTYKVLDLLKLFFPDFDFYVKVIKTSGDKKIYTNNSFVKELEEALVNEEIDIAVNSLKDMPYNINEHTNIAAVLKREEVNDILISKDNKSFWDLEPHRVIGTSSLRRKEQLKLLRPDLIFKDITGNVDTRIKKLNNLGDYDAIVLAKAAITRLNLEHFISYEFSIEEVVPAVGQGVIALQTRKNSFLNQILSKINDIKTFLEIAIEREIMGILKLGCRNPLGLYVSIENNFINIYYFFIYNGNIFRGRKQINLINNKNFQLIINLIKDPEQYHNFKNEVYYIVNDLANDFIKETGGLSISF
jgi:hydroxymethylbilane synthase